MLAVFVSPLAALCFLSASAAFLVSASTSFFICAERFSSHPFGSHSPGQPHFAPFEHEQVLFDSFSVQPHLFFAATADPAPSSTSPSASSGSANPNNPLHLADQGIPMPLSDARPEFFSMGRALTGVYHELVTGHQAH